MIRKPTFRQVLSFSAADLVAGEIMSLHTAAIAIGEVKRMDDASFKKSEILQAGLFGGASAIPTPGVNANDAIPKPEDFVNIPYRFISATIVGGESWKATDFSLDGVLEASLPLFKGTPIYSDHNAAADNWAGIVTEPYYQKSFSHEGMVIPAGINGNASIDTKVQYALARGIMLGAIGSNSVTTQFDWEPSHKFTNMTDFYDKIGTFDAEGKMVRRVCKEVKAYFETSMLLAGADPFAKKLDAQGRPIKIDKTSVYFSKADPKEKETYEGEKKFGVFEDLSKELISLSQTSKKPAPVKTSTSMNKFLLAFLKTFGQALSLSFSVTDENATITPEQETEAIGALAKLGLAKAEDPNQVKIVDFTKTLQFVNDKNEVSAFDPLTAAPNSKYLVMLEATHTANTLALTKLTTEKAALEPQAKLGKDYLEAKREETVRLYKLSAGDNADAAVEATIKAAAPDALDGFLKMYGGEVKVKYSATCTKCNSGDNVEMRSTFAKPTVKDEETTERVLDFSDLSETGLFTRNRKPATVRADA